MWYERRKASGRSHFVILNVVKNLIHVVLTPEKYSGAYQLDKILHYVQNDKRRCTKLLVTTQQRREVHQILGDQLPF